MVAYIPLITAAGALINGLFGRAFIKRKAHWVAVLASGAAFILSCVIFADLARHGGAREIVIFEWIYSGPLRLDMAFLVDPLSMFMAVVVTGVGFLIHIYSIGYMHDDGGYHRYFAYLNLFMTAMLILVLANNYVLMFLGWEGVGLCSYLLIGFWFHKDSAANAAKKAFLVNRIGDAAFIIALFLIFKETGSLVFSEAAHGFHHISRESATLICILLFAGATGKSAQIPLFVWLPDAMEGPTSVSALIHAATMVTAGVYMVTRNAALFALAPDAMQVVATVGACTAIFAASIALVQRDIKKVLAYSTVSQLGYMFLGCGVGAYVSAMFHLMTHAFFKGLLFLGSGSVIHGMSGEQDMRYMGGLRKHLPVTFWTFAVATVAIAGIPPLAGFWSKDEILGETFKNGHVILWTIGMITALMTAFYMFRLLFMTFFGPSRVSEEVKHHLHESPLSMTVPLSILAFLSVVGGILPGFPPERGWIHRFLGPVVAGPHHGVSHGGAHAVHHAGLFGLSSLDFTLMGISVGAAVLGVTLAWWFYIVRTDLPGRIRERIKGVHEILLNKYWIDELYAKLFVRPILRLCAFFWKVDAEAIDGIVNGAAHVTRRAAKGSFRVDQNVVDGIVNGVGRFMDAWHLRMRKLQTGFVQQYALVMVLGAFCLVASTFIFNRG